MVINTAVGVVCDDDFGVEGHHTRAEMGRRACSMLLGVKNGRKLKRVRKHSEPGHAAGLLDAMLGHEHDAVCQELLRVRPAEFAHLLQQCEKTGLRSGKHISAGVKLAMTLEWLGHSITVRRQSATWKCSISTVATVSILAILRCERR